MNILQTIEINGQRVLTTRQLTEMYQTAEWRVKQNFKENREKYVRDKHYILLSGEKLRRLKSEVGNSYLVGKTANKLYLWTEKGALLHAKSINTDKAWEVYEYLVDFYFRIKESKKPEPEHKTNAHLYVNAPDNSGIQTSIRRIKDELTCMNVMLDRCSMYLKEDDYIQTRNVMAGMLGMLIGDCEKLRMAKYEMVEKH